ncbi:MAG: prepilin peptidase [Parvularculaceae bacterium]|nr:prepilin peptidase [Parvularculaceae bacterium]
MISVILMAVYPAALLIAAANDLFEFKIPNWISIVLVVAYVAAGLVLGAPTDVFLGGLLIGAGALVLGFVLFAFRIFGGGDAKLLAALAPWLGVSAAFQGVVNIAFAGGIVAMALIIFRRTPVIPLYARSAWLLQLHERRKEIPYGIAIAAGGLMTFPSTPYFQLAYGG